MKRFFPVALAGALALATAHVPAATAAAPTLSQTQSEELVTSYAPPGRGLLQEGRQAGRAHRRARRAARVPQGEQGRNPALPALKATDDDTTNVRALEREVNTAVESYGTSSSRSTRWRPRPSSPMPRSRACSARSRTATRRSSRPGSSPSSTRASTAPRSAASESPTRSTRRRTRCTSRTSSSTAPPTRPGCSPRTRSSRSTASRPCSS